MKQKPRNNPIMSMVFDIDNGIEIKERPYTRDEIRKISSEVWVLYIAEYLYEKNRSQSARVNFGHYGEWFTPDILSTNFRWERI